MMPATTRKPRKRVTDSEKIQELEERIRVYESRFTEIDVFLDFVRDQADELKEKRHRLAEAKDAYDTIKREVADLTEAISGAKDSLFHVLEPGAMKALPLFDQMEPADEKTHGVGSDQWRQEPIGSLRLSAATNALLIAADVVLIGQLQDRVLASPANWYENIDGMGAPVAAAIVDKLNDFIFEACRGGK